MLYLPNWLISNLKCFNYSKTLKTMMWRAIKDNDALCYNYIQ